MKTLLALALLLFGAAAFAQSSPHLAYVYPAGGKAGTTFQIVVGGQFLTTASNAFFTGPGITATVLDHRRPIGQKEFGQLKDRLKALQEKSPAARKGTVAANAWTGAAAKESAEIRAKILKNPPNRKVNPSMIDTVILQVTIATNAAPGEQEIRLATPNALSNPLKFLVGDLPEISKPAAQAVNPDLDKYLEKIGGRPATTGTPKYEARVTLPATINGQIMPGGVDRYRFTALRGQQIVIAASARSLIPYLADAVPGWFESVLTIYDSKGKELASEERFRFKPDPVVHFEAPRDCEYTLEIHDSIYRGREDFVYRVTLGQLPYVTGISPLGGQAGKTSAVTLSGWNLAKKQMDVENSAVEAGIISLDVKAINTVPFAVDPLPEVISNGENSSAETAQRVALPAIVNGAVRQQNRPEVFKFDGRAGQQIVAEVYARRLDSLLDSFLRLTDAEGKSLAFNDDFEDKGTGLNTHHADSYLTATLPADGAYFIHLTDTQGRGGAEYGYRLRISEPQPDFALRIVPASLNLRADLSGPLTVFALRRDGFTNAIDLALKDAPAGFSLSGAKIPAGQDKAQFTLNAPASPTAAPVAISVEGQALINGRLVAHTAMPAEDMMQAFIYRHLVQSKELYVMVAGRLRPFFRDSFKITSPTPIKISPGEIACVKVSITPAKFTDRFHLELENAPEGVSLKKVSPTSAGLELEFLGDAQQLKPGSSGNLICSISLKNQEEQTNPKKSAKQNRRYSATLPAIPFECPAP